MTDFIYREGKPRLTECQFQHLMGRRSSGLYGSGLYAYRSKDIATHRCSHSGTDCYEIDVSKLNFYKPENLDNIIDLSAHMMNGIRKYEENVSDEWLEDDIRRIKDLDINLYEVKEAIERANWCRQNINDPFGKQCTLPINYLLLSKGFDGIEPEGSAANKNQFGVVIFKEIIDNIFDKNHKCLEEDIDIGVKI